MSLFWFGSFGSSPPDRLECRGCGFGAYASRVRLPSGRLAALCRQCQRKLTREADSGSKWVARLEAETAERDARKPE